MNPQISHSVCAAVSACDYREAIPLLRDIFSMITMDRGGTPIANLLSMWKDEESKEMLIEKLHMETNNSQIGNLMKALKEYGNSSIKDTILEIKEQFPEAKVKAIDNYIKNW